MPRNIAAMVVPEHTPHHHHQCCSALDIWAGCCPLGPDLESVLTWLVIGQLNASSLHWVPKKERERVEKEKRKGKGEKEIREGD